MIENIMFGALIILMIKKNNENIDIPQKDKKKSKKR
jgi:hypothetical protein